MLIFSIQSFHDVAVILKQKPVKVYGTFFRERFPNFLGESRKFSNVIPMNSPFDADHKNMKEIEFRRFWADLDFLSTMLRVVYYLRYRFSRPVLSCVMSGPSELSIDAIKILGLFPTLWSVCESLQGVARN